MVPAPLSEKVDKILEAHRKGMIDIPRTVEDLRLALEGRGADVKQREFERLGVSLLVESLSAAPVQPVGGTFVPNVHAAIMEAIASFGPPDTLPMHVFSLLDLENRDKTEAWLQTVYPHFRYVLSRFGDRLSTHSLNWLKGTCSMLAVTPGELILQRRIPQSVVEAATELQRIVEQIEFARFEQTLRPAVPEMVRRRQQPVAISVVPCTWSEEADAVKSNLSEASLPNLRVLLHHFDQAESLSLKPDVKATSVGQWRCFFEQLIEDIVESTAANRSDFERPPGGVSNHLTWLTKVGFLLPDEEQAGRAVWAYLCGGSHPGIPAAHAAHIARMMTVGLGEVLVLKYLDWKKNQFHSFSTDPV